MGLEVINAQITECQQKIEDAKAEVKVIRSKINKYEKLKGELNNTILANLKKSSNGIGGIKQRLNSSLSGNIADQEQRNILRCKEEIREVIIDINVINSGIDKEIKKLNEKIAKLNAVIKANELMIKNLQISTLQDFGTSTTLPNNIFS